MTHHALEGVAIMRTQPRLGVIESADPERSELWHRYGVASTA
jgi:transketolase C-terminal domain/subunit